MNAGGSISFSTDDFLNHFPEGFFSPTYGESFSINRFSLIILPQFDTNSPTKVSLFVNNIKPKFVVRQGHVFNDFNAELVCLAADEMAL